MAYRLDVSVVREAARGHWDAIFCALAPMLKAAMQQPGKHVPCPVHGGKDGFRLFPDYAERQVPVSAIHAAHFVMGLRRWSGCMAGALPKRSNGCLVCWGFNLDKGKKSLHAR